MGNFSSPGSVQEIRYCQRSQPGDAEIGVRQVFGSTDADGFHLAVVGGFDAGERVFEDQAFFRFQAESFRSFQEDFRIRFSVGHHRTVNNGIEEIPDIQAVQDDPAVFASTAERGLETPRFGLCQKFLRARQRTAGRVRSSLYSNVPSLPLSSPGRRSRE